MAFQYKNMLSKGSGLYGVAHALSCPQHGALGLALKLGIIGLPGPVISIIEYPHNFMTHTVFEPIYEQFIDEPHAPTPASNLHPRILEAMHLDHEGHNHDSHSEPRAEHYAHITTDVLGWGMFGTFLALQGAKLYNERKVRN